MNEKLATIFREMAALYRIDDVQFKPAAYEKAADAVLDWGMNIKTVYKEQGIKGLMEIPGVGKGIAEKIEEYIETGHIKEYEQMRKKLPADIEGITRVEGVGPRMVKKLYEELGIKTVDQLEAAAKKGKIRSLPGFGEKTEQKILKSLAYLETSRGRVLLYHVLPIARRIVERLRQHPKVKKAEYAGSLRRMQEMIGDIDILVTSTDPKTVMDFFIKMPEVSAVIAKGLTKTAVRLKMGMNADLRIVPPESFGAALQYFTGDKQHNVSIRKLAIDKGYKLNEYGLYKGTRLVAGQTEAEIYERLGLDYIEPEMRTDSGEIEVARKGRLPQLVGYDDVRGDLQVQTDWTDGNASILEMAKAAQKHGLEYIAITDHTASLTVTGGLNEKRLRRQMAEIDKLQKKLSHFKILKGSEVDILKDGSLDIDDETLAMLDVVGASVHSHFGMSEKDMTERIIRAMENPHIDIIFHPTGRVMQRREPYKVDIDALIKAAKRTKTVLEIDAYPDRLDLKDEHIRKAVEAGVRLSIDSDAHSPEHFPYLEYGIGQARRGWAEKKDIINAHSWQQMLKMLK